MNEGGGKEEGEGKGREGSTNCWDDSITATASSCIFVLVTESLFPKGGD